MAERSLDIENMIERDMEGSEVLEV